MAFHGLFIGIDRYASPQINWLSCACRDAEALEALFSDTLGGTATLLTNEKATRKVIEQEFQKLSGCNPDDTVVIAFSGHGSETHELVTYDASLDDLPQTAIPLDELAKWFADIPAKNLVLFLDCCFSGGMGAKVLHVEAVPKSIKSVDTRLSEMSGKGRIILTASGPTEPAWENHKHGHGFFTHVLLEALQGPEEIAQGDRLPLYPLLEYVTRRVIDFARQIGRSQNPTLRGTIDGALDWPVFVPGDRFLAAFPDHAGAKVSSEIDSLAAFGFPSALLNAWGEAIPSLNQLQIDAVNEFGILSGEDLVVSAPTSSGKTMIGELAALKCLQNRQRALFLLPLKALVADKVRHFDSVYGSFGIRTIEATGETDDISDLLRGQYDIALLTYEKFAAIALTYPHVLGQVGVVVVDETQMLADESRGANLEFLLTLIQMRRREGIEPQLISLSAVIGDMNNFEHWLGARLLRRTERPVPLDEGLLLGDGRFRYLDGETFEEKEAGPIVQPLYSGKNSSQDVIIPLVQKLTSEGEQLIVFRETKGHTRGCARYLANALQLPPASDALSRLPGGDLSQASEQLREVLAHGVCFHNADLDREERRIIEEEFRKENSQIKVIVATTTLAMGVNTPASAVVIAGLMHPGDNPYSVAEYKNLIGRAGRLGFAEHGTSYLIALDSHTEHNFWNQYVTAAPENLQSRFLDPNTDPRSLIVRVLVAVPSASGGGISAEHIAEFLEASFGAFQETRRTGHWQWSRDDLLAALADLERHDLVETRPEGKYELTRLGRLSGESATEVASIIRLVDCLGVLAPEDITDPALIAAVQMTREVDDVYFPINKRSTIKEPETWFGELRRQGISRHVLNQFSRDTHEAHQEALRAKKAAACLLYITGREMNELEDILTQHGGRFNGAAGPIRGVAARTCDLLPTAARVAEILHAETDFGNRIGRLAIRLTHGVSGKAVELARCAGANLGRGDYARLSQHGLCDPDAISAASDQNILDCLDNDPIRLQHVRNAVKAMKANEMKQVKIQSPVLEPYKA